MKRALIAMSGGVDSSAAVYLCQKEGYDCAGVTMQLSAAAKEQDMQDAQALAKRFSIPHTILQLQAQFDENVITPFIQSYEAGETPNPCIICNQRLKFGRLLEEMRAENRDTLVTGHYARVVYDESSKRYLLKKGLDHTKDQSYVLYHLTQEQLAHIYFPLGEYTKAQIRTIASEHQFENANKPDSQDICFIPDGDYVGFIERYTGKTFPSGDFIDRDGNRIGTHRGILHYTIGQRRGLGISSTEPLYVTKIDAEHNTVTLGRNEDLFSTTLTAHHPNWISGIPFTEPTPVLAKIRYRHTEQPAKAYETPDGILHVTFDAPQRAITRGQSVVLYDCDGETVLGGGIIQQGTTCTKYTIFTPENW